MYSKILSVKKISFAVLLLIVIFVFREVVVNQLRTEVAVIISLTTFIYGFFINSIFSFAEAKFQTFKTTMAEFSALVQSLYDISKLTKQKKFINLVQKKLSSLVKIMQKTNPENYENTQDLMETIFAMLNNFQPKTSKQGSHYKKMLDIIVDMTIVREKLELFGDKYIVGQVKFLFLFFPIFISLMLLFLSVNNVVILIMSLVLILILFFTTVLIQDIDSLGYGKFVINTRNLDQLLTTLKKK